MTAQNQRIEFVPQGRNPQTEQLKLSIAIELLYNHAAAMEVIIMGDPEFYGDHDLQKFIETVNFLNEHGGKKMNAPTVAENILAEREQACAYADAFNFKTR